MQSTSHSSNNFRNLEALASTNPVHVGPFNVPNHQTAAYQPVAYQPSPAFQPDASAIMLPPSNHVVTLANVTVEKPSGYAAKKAWTRHHALIKQLYFHDKKPLTEFMRFMEREHGFRATVKMYKTHIKQWGLDKKNKEPEMRAIVYKHKQRADQGKKSTIRVRGQPRDFIEVVHYWKLKGKPIDDVIAQQTAPRTFEAVEVFTPPPFPILTPSKLAIPERMFRCIRDYFKGSFASGTWISTEPEVKCRSIKDKTNTGDNWNDLVTECGLVCSLMTRELSYEAVQTLSIATERIQQILLAEHPATLAELFSLLANLRRRERAETASFILRHFCERLSQSLDTRYLATSTEV